MSFADAIKTCFSKYVDFSGRARRSEFWYWALFVFLVDIVTNIVDRGVGNMALGSLVGLALFLPGLAVTIRRLHDTGRSGWWVLLVFAIVIGWIFLIIWYCEDSGPDNQYGPNPKGMTGYGAVGYGTPPPPPPPPMPPMPPTPSA